MRFMTLVFAVWFMAFSLHAQPSERLSIDTGQSFDAYILKLKESILAHKMGMVGEACATCGANAIGITIPGNRIIMIFNPHFAVRMLKASISAGIEAPLRLYVTEKKDGMAELTYQKPSLVFAPYGVKDLDDMAKELDQIIAEIVQDSL